MSFFTDLQGLVGDIFDELGVPPSSVRRKVTRKLTTAERVAEFDPSIITTFFVRAIVDEVTRKTDDGSFQTTTEAILDGEVKIGDIITIGNTSFTVETVKKSDPILTGALYWEATLS